MDNQEVEKNILSLVVDSLTGNTPLMYAVMENKVTILLLTQENIFWKYPPIPLWDMAVSKIIFFYIFLPRFRSKLAQSVLTCTFYIFLQVVVMFSCRFTYDFQYINFGDLRYTVLCARILKYS